MSAVSTATAVSVQGLSRTYRSSGGDVHALADVTLDVPRGQLVALVGRSGSGKTTLLNCIGGLDRPTAGRVHVGEHEVTALDEAGRTRLRRDELAFVFQTFGLVPLLSAAENVGLPMRLRRVAPAEREARVAHLLGLVGLTPHAAQRPAELSGGQQQRVAVARALVNNPKLLLADEPTGALDSKTSEEIMALFCTLNTEGITVVVVTHEPDVAEYAKRRILFRDGQVVEDVAQAGYMGRAAE